LKGLFGGEEAMASHKLKFYVVIVHWPCLDGNAALYALKKSLDRGFVEVIHVDFRVPPTIKTENPDQIFLLDTHAHCDLLTEKYPGKVTVIDHHQRNPEEWKYPERIRDDSVFSPDTKESACLLVYKKLPSSFSDNERKKIVAVSKGDTFNFEGPEDKEDIMCFRLAAMQDENFMNEEISFEDLLQKGRSLRKEQMILKEEYIQSWFLLKLPNGTSVCAIERKDPKKDNTIMSEVGESVSIAQKSIVMFYAYDNDHVNLSFRSSSDDLRCDILAKELSPTGGGHKRAAGSFLHLKDWIQFFPCIAIVGGQDYHGPTAERDKKVALELGKRLASHVPSLLMINGGTPGIPMDVFQGYLEAGGSPKHLVSCLSKKYEPEFHAQEKKLSHGLVVGDTQEERRIFLAQKLKGIHCVCAIQGGQYTTHELKLFDEQKVPIMALRGSGGAAGGQVPWGEYGYVFCQETLKDPKKLAQALLFIK
jgi:hypothetical protein